MSESDSDAMVRARVLADRGDYREALECLRLLCEQEPYNPEPWLDMAEMARCAGLSYEAAAALFHVADLYARAGMAEAADIAEQVLELEPTHLGARQFVTMFKGRQLGLAAPDHLPHASSDDAGALFLPDPDFHDDHEAVVLGGGGGHHASAAEAGGPSTPSVFGMQAGHIKVRDTQPIERAPFTLARDDESTTLAREQLVMSLLSSTSSRFLDALDQKTVRALVRSASLERCRKGEILFRQGEPGDSLFLILEGGLDVERLDSSGASRKLATLEPGAFFGEMAILANAPRSATVRARSDAVVLRVSRASVEQLSERDPGVRELLMRFFRARLVGTLMATSPLFTPLSVDDRRSLVGYFRMRELPEQRVVLEQARPSDGLYLVLVGKLGAYVRDAAGAEQMLGSLGPGDVFGEMSFITGEPAMASIVALEHSWVLRLPREDLDRLVLSHPHVLMQLRAIADARQSKNRKTLEHRAPD